MNYFITETYLKNYTAITRNVDATDIMPLIRPSSDRYIKDILGSYFYDYMLSGYNAQSLTASEYNLYKEIQPAIAWMAAKEAVYTLTYQLKNKGLQKQDGENSSAPDQNETIMIYKHYESWGKYYLERVRKHLLINKDLFPEYTSDLNNDCELTDIRPSNEDPYNDDMLMI